MMLSVRDEQIASLGWKSIKSPQIQCGSGNRICQICINKDCLFEAFKCSEDECKSCQPKNHTECNLRNFSQLTNKVEGKLNFKVKILRSIFEIQEKLMKQLRESRMKLMSQDEDRYEEKLPNSVQSIYDKKNIKGLTGAKMSQIFLQLNPSKSQQDKIEKQLSKLKIEGDKIIKGLANIREQVYDSLAEKIYQQVDSKILSSDQRIYLLKQLNNPIKLKRLFRASQHDFSAAKFHEHCDGISDTVTIVRTEFGKTIAAYTPLKWSSEPNSVFTADESKRTFLLQLQLKQKMTLIQPQYAISNYKNSGPTFGGSHDLKITDQCNQNQKSYSYFPTSFNCEGKYHRNQESYTAFCGNPSGIIFKVLEYEVFAVIK